MHSKLSRRIPALALLAHLALCGCWKGKQPAGPAPFPVSGSVVVNGLPAAGMRVIFHPQFDVGRLKFSPFDITDYSGRFQLRSYSPGDGAPVGDYVVTLEWPTSLKDEENGSAVEDRLKGHYAKPIHPFTRIAIHEGDNKLAPFEVAVP